MSFYEKGPVRIHYEERGSGFPLLLIAGGGLNSTISGLTTGSPFDPIEEFKGEYRLIAADLRNAVEGQSTGPLELNPVTADRPAGFSHYGLHVENAAQAVARFRKNGLTVTDTNTSDTKAILANITDPYMGRIELTELPPESLHYKAIQNWK